MNDKNRGEYVKLSQLKPGDFVEIDESLDCMDRGGLHEVKSVHGEMYLVCDHGYHFLKGQLETDNDSLIGVYSIHRS